MGEYRKLWWSLIGVLGVTFCLLGWFGHEIYRQAPPIPQQVQNVEGKTLFGASDILDGQTAWQSIGGMQLGSIWGHGAYQAPDWTADWLHRELLAWLDLAAQQSYAKPYQDIGDDQQALLRHQLKREYRGNRLLNGTLVLSERRVQAIAQTAAYYHALFGNDAALHGSRESFAMKENTLPDAARREQLTHFFFWTAWAAATERDGQTATFTNNWPHEPLIDNHPTAENMVWSIVSIVVLLAGVGFLVWGWAFLRNHEDGEPKVPLQDPLSLIKLTPSQKALGKYLLLVGALFGFQVLMGGVTAHYTVEGQDFYGVPLSKWFPYSLTRTWHLQSAMFWIATGFLAAGLFLAPFINGGKDPKWQKLGVDVLFWALVLVVVVVGSYAGNFLAIAQLMPQQWSFWLGHQGYEYVDLGRLWQIAKFAGIVFWLVLMLRAMVPALRQPGDKNLLALLAASVVAIGLFYGAGLFYGERTNLSVMEYWRWWVVHLWVEGFFEVFATTALAFIFTSMGLVSKRLATTATLGSASLFMLGGVPGTFHHIYFAGTTTPVMAVGATFSALEVVPLILLGHEAWENWRLKERAPWMAQLRWPLQFFIATAFWNMLGAGVFGFLINPPIALYYIQGLNTTPLHAHAALFGVYGSLALGFCLLILRYLRPNLRFNDRLMKTGFWWLNGGLMLMIVTSLLPIGLLQFYASASQGLWYARSEAFMQQNLLQTLRWVRTFGDIVFLVGAFAVIWQIAGGLLFSSRHPRAVESATVTGQR
ncbi:nitric oxide reductase large subunit [Pseudomonas fluorescens]|uniref:nitric-oxide reductase large subunit n=1 Tax=Pseudomonas fluorescens TaxID=294 RepID=UPI00054BBADE|nr:nitric-oxide reductase large subunit [Pseudomonas fluorescens]KII27916.1 nitric oxide reductase large subunit [Pseudomonas fluorescens]